MRLWLFGVICAIGLAASGLTLYSTDQTMHQLQALRVQRARVVVAHPAPQASASVPAAARPARPTILRPVATSPGAAAEPQAMLRLLGTMLEADPFRSSAIMEDPSTRFRHTYRLGDHVAGGRLAAVERGFVLLDGDAGLRRIDLERASSSNQPEAEAGAEPGGLAGNWQPVTEQMLAVPDALNGEQMDTVKRAITPVSDTERIVNRRAVWETVGGNPFQVLREASLRPAFGAGGLIGIQLTALPEDGVLRQSGFEPGDVIRTVNGQAVTDPSAILKMPEQLVHSDVVEVQVERNGQPLTLTYRMR